MLAIIVLILVVWLLIQAPEVLGIIILGAGLLVSLLSLAVLCH